MNTSPNREKNQGAPRDEAAIIQNTPKIIAIRAIRILYIFLIIRNSVLCGNGLKGAERC